MELENIEHLYNFNFRPFFITLLFGVALYFAFQFIYRFLIYLIRSERYQRKTLNVLPVVERISWAVFAVLVLLSLVKPNPIWGTLMVAILVAATWIYIKNYLSGIMFLLSPDYKIGQHIQIEAYRGTIKALKSVRFVLELDNGELLILPYNEIVGKGIIKTNPSEKVLSHTVTLFINKPCNLLIEKEKLSRKTMSMPWLIPGAKPNIEVLAETDEKYTIAITLRAVDKAHLQLIEQRLMIA